MPHPPILRTVVTFHAQGDLPSGLRPARRYHATFREDGVPPPWAAMISQHHALGLRSVDAYIHPRAGAVSIAFGKRMKRIAQRARKRRLHVIARLATKYRFGVLRFGGRGATDYYMAALQRVRFVQADEALAALSGDDRRRARRLVDLMQSAIDDLAAGRKGRGDRAATRRR